MHVFLKVKIKSLAEEARIIRLEERKANKGKCYYTQSTLREHRVGVVRYEVRHSLLAYQYIRGKTFCSCESKNADISKIDWGKVRKIISRFSDSRTTEGFCHESWIKGKILKAA